MNSAEVAAGSTFGPLGPTSHESHLDWLILLQLQLLQILLGSFYGYDHVLQTIFKFIKM